MIVVTLQRSTGRFEVSRQGKVFTQGKAFNLRHYRAIEERFKAWDKLGWPYEPKE
jgi:hypothetical protein